MSVEIWSDKNSYPIYGGHQKVESVLLIKVDHVGDFILALDAIIVLRSRFPEARISLICAPWNLQIAKRLNIFDEIFTIAFFDVRADGEKKILSAETIASLPTRRYDLAIDLRVDADTRVLMDHVDASYKCGYESPYVATPLTIALPWILPRSAENNLATHQALLMLRLVHSVSDFFRMTSAVPELLRLRLADECRLDLSFADGRILVLCNTSSGRDAKNWPVGRFRELIRWLCLTMDVAVLLVGAPDQVAEAERIRVFCDSPLLASAVGVTSMPEAIDLVGKASLYIGNDSGLTHIAARLGVPTIDILSGIDPAAMWVPIGPNVTAVKAPVPCSPCHILALSQCRFEHACIENISLDFVKAVVRKNLLTCALRPKAA